MPLIQITNTYSGAVLDIVKKYVPAGFEIRLLEENTKENLLSKVADADYILASGRVKIDAEVLDAANNLKMIQRTGVGLDSIDLEALKQRGIPLYVNRGVNADSVAEHTLLLMLACLRKLTLISQNTKNGIWKKQQQGIGTMELRGRTVGMIGMGNIGRKTANLLRAFGANLMYYDAYRLPADMEAQLGLQYAEPEALFQNADILTLHCALTEKTREIICAESIRSMKDGVILVNTARGGLICESALLAALQSGKVGFAGLDVFAEEPAKNTELLAQPNLIATPHIAGVTYDSFSQIMRGGMRNIAAYHAGDLTALEQSRII